MLVKERQEELLDHTAPYVKAGSLVCCALVFFVAWWGSKQKNVRMSKTLYRGMKPKQKSKRPFTKGHMFFFLRPHGHLSAKL